MLKVVTYSPAFTLVPTYECFNRCTYCNFRAEPGSSWISLDTAREVLSPLLAQGICEILLLSGEVHPKSARRTAWVNHIFRLCDLALELGFLPHTNVGPLSLAEMQHLKSVNASMGLMLEQMTPKLLQTVHRNAPSKDPRLRLQQLEQAGILQIPFTTGLLIGIGETEADRIETLQAIAQAQQNHGHIQEVILQPHRPAVKSTSSFEWQIPEDELEDLLVATVKLAWQILPADIRIQIPPNLTRATLACVSAGARDLGGIGPKDHVNPDYPHPDAQQLTQLLSSGGFQLQQRLPVYPQYFDWVPEQVQPNLKFWQDRSPAYPSKVFLHS